MKMIYALIFILILGYIFLKRKKKAFQESNLMGRLLHHKFTVSLSHPFDENEILELMSINEDDSATIRTLRSDEILTAKPSEYFIGKDFGSMGLRLLSTSQEKQIIQLEHTVPDEDVE